MTDDDKLTRLIAAIYDAALDCALWPDVLAGIADFVDGRVGGLLAKDSSLQEMGAHARAKVRRDVTFPRCAAKLAAILNEVVD